MSANKQHSEYVIMTRPALSDAEFVLRLHALPEQQRFVIAVREALSEICRVPPTAIYPEDTPESLVKLAGDWDDLPVVMYLEEVLGVEIEKELPTFLGWRFFWLSKPGPASVGEWVLTVSAQLHASLTDAPVH